MKIDLQDIIGNFAKEISLGETESIRSFLIATIQDIRNELKEHRENYTEQENNTNYIAAVSFRGVLDYVNLLEMTSRPNWERDPKSLEKVWIRLWDCKERIEAHNPGLAGAYIDGIKDFLNHLFEYYFSCFGPGMYMSPDLKVKLRLCTVCGNNIKKCDHVPGRLYNGEMCRQLLTDVEARSVSLVSNPRDPRCRIWPWNMESDGESCQVLVLALFSVDDFLQDDPWPKVGIKWPEGTLSDEAN